MEIKSVLFVCLGNICRSPLGDGILRRKIKERGLQLTVDSAGTANYHIGKGPDERMVATAKKRGTDIAFLRARQFSAKDFRDFDLIYVMDKSNYSNVIRLAENEAQRNKVRLALDELFPGEEQEVPDPYYGGQDGFDHVYELMDQVTDKIILKIKN
ncbi:MAG: low molecular weight phosphotyrosine protein phosphatase [Crocinitomicaceae bacterium]|jgi:protein-tyrosine phosphatase|nr:low molecular weight phosphotyrosine protein phosphatase [Crocinitomicaceae bacterium]